MNAKKNSPFVIVYITNVSTQSEATSVFVSTGLFADRVDFVLVKLFDFLDYKATTNLFLSIIFETFNYICFNLSDFNECEQFQPCDDNSVCVNTLGSYRCDCLKGFERLTLNSMSCSG
jgi:hypothetical protein